MDAITLLKQDHKAVKKLFTQFQKTGDRAHTQRRRLVDQMIKELAVHSVIEESIFYPAVRELVDDANDDVLESLEEHHVMKWLLSELEDMDPKDERFKAKTTVMIETTSHHIEEEESELFPEVRSALGRKKLGEIGDTMEEAKKVAPTRPHPRAPDEPPGNIVAAAVSAPADRLREVGKEAVEAAKQRLS